MATGGPKAGSQRHRPGALHPPHWVSPSELAPAAKAAMNVSLERCSGQIIRLFPSCQCLYIIAWENMLTGHNSKLPDFCHQKVERGWGGLIVRSL